MIIQQFQKWRIWHSGFGPRPFCSGSRCLWHLWDIKQTFVLFPHFSVTVITRTKPVNVSERECVWVWVVKEREREKPSDGNNPALKHFVGKSPNHKRNIYFRIWFHTTTKMEQAKSFVKPVDRQLHPECVYLIGKNHQITSNVKAGFCGLRLWNAPITNQDVRYSS